MRQQWASVHELARLEMLAGVPGETLAQLAERMERVKLAPGERCDTHEQIVAVLDGFAHATDASGERTAVEPGSVVPDAAVALRAVTPVTIVRCLRVEFDALVGSPSGGA